MLNLTCWDWSFKDFNCGEPLLDGNGNVYSTININGRCWLQENYKFGNRVLKWVELNSCRQNGVTEVLIIKGKERNGGYYPSCEIFIPAMSGNICPKGWHVPDNNEWLSLIEFYKNDLNTFINQFNILPTAYYLSNGDSITNEYAAYFASSSRTINDKIDYFYMHLSNGTKPRIGSNFFNENALCVRCIKDL